jgi:hypothetical protein
MKVLPVLFTGLAEEDLDQIEDYIAAMISLSVWNAPFASPQQTSIQKGQSTSLSRASLAAFFEAFCAILTSSGRGSSGCSFPKRFR